MVHHGKEREVPSRSVVAVNCLFLLHLPPPGREQAAGAKSVHDTSSCLGKTNLYRCAGKVGRELSRRHCRQTKNRGKACVQPPKGEVLANPSDLTACQSKAYSSSGIVGGEGQYSHSGVCVWWCTLLFREYGPHWTVCLPHSLPSTLTGNLGWEAEEAIGKRPNFFFLEKVKGT